MIQTKEFTLEVLKTHKVFFLLDTLPKHATEVDVWVKTPTGNESVDFIDVFRMADGSLLAAWQHPFQKLPLHNLIVFCEGKVQILNLYPVERMINLYNRPIDSDSGTFHFVNSTPIAGGDWRCDRGMYGPQPFKEEQVNRIIDEINEIVFYEPFLGVNGFGHVIYLQATGKSELAVEKLNNSVVPITTRTFQECLRLIYEWSVLAKEPFNSTDDCVVSSDAFLKNLLFTDEELGVLENLPPMQIGQFLSGSANARQRPTNLSELTSDIENILWRRMASSSLCFIVAHNPAIWDFDEILQAELNELDNGFARFREYYEIPESEPLSTSKALEYAETSKPTEIAYIKNQLAGFRNKQTVMAKAIADREHNA